MTFAEDNFNSNRKRKHSHSSRRNIANRKRLIGDLQQSTTDNQRRNNLKIKPEHVDVISISSADSSASINNKRRRTSAKAVKSDHRNRRNKISYKRLSQRKRSKNDRSDINNKDSDCVIVGWKRQDVFSSTTPMHFNTQADISDIFGSLNVFATNSENQDQDLAKSSATTSFGKFNRKQNQQTTCPICLKSLEGRFISSTICGHVFCSKCIKAAVQRLKYCPTCRKPLNLLKIHPLYI